VNRRTCCAAGVRCGAPHTFTFGENLTLHKTCSVGYTAFPVLPGAPDQFGWEQVLELADQCLYAAKKSGRDGWVGALVQESGAQSDIALHTLPCFGPCIIRTHGMTAGTSSGISNWPVWLLAEAAHRIDGLWAAT
jgi:hypothetical protein